MRYVALMLLMLALAACGSSSTSTTSAKASTATSSPSAQVVTCASLANVIKPVVKDQASQDASLEQGWVDLVAPDSGTNLTSQGQDLQNAANATTSISTGPAPTSLLGIDVLSFYTDANAFLNDESVGLMPGWIQPYDALKSDIQAIAALCGYPSRPPKPSRLPGSRSHGRG
jgi:hypothetical protein